MSMLLFFSSLKVFTSPPSPNYMKVFIAALFGCGCLLIGGSSCCCQCCCCLFVWLCLCWPRLGSGLIILRSVSDHLGLISGPFKIRPHLFIYLFDDLMTANQVLGGFCFSSEATHESSSYLQTRTCDVFVDIRAFSGATRQVLQVTLQNKSCSTSKTTRWCLYHCS